MAKLSKAEEKMLDVKAKPKRLTMALGLGLLLFGLVGGCGGKAQDKKKESPVVAKVDDQVITYAELEQAVAVPLARLDEQRSQLLESKLDEMIGERLLNREAKRRGVTVEALLTTEVVSKIPEVTEAEITAFITQNKGRLQGTTAELRPQVRDYLKEQKVSKLGKAYVAGLREAAKVERLLEEPEPIRIPVKSEGTFVQGSKDAPVTIVEFTDFQCPFCRTVVATLKDVMQQYPGRVKWVFRDFPLASLHPKAPKVAEAARCAGEQGKFWEYHDLLFDTQARATIADLKQFAEDLKLDSKSFGPCLDSGKHRAAVEADVQEGSRLGITGTPTFFINGRMLVGAQPLERFKKIIEAELRRHSK